MICTDDLGMASSNLYDNTETLPICKHSIDTYEYENTSTLTPNTHSGLGGVDHARLHSRNNEHTPAHTRPRSDIHACTSTMRSLRW